MVGVGGDAACAAPAPAAAAAAGCACWAGEGAAGEAGAAATGPAAGAASISKRRRRDLREVKNRGADQCKRPDPLYAHSLDRSSAEASRVARCAVLGRVARVLGIAAAARRAEGGGAQSRAEQGNAAGAQPPQQGARAGPRAGIESHRCGDWPRAGVWRTHAERGQCPAHRAVQGAAARRHVCERECAPGGPRRGPQRRLFNAHAAAQGGGQVCHSLSPNCRHSGAAQGELDVRRWHGGGCGPQKGRAGPKGGPGLFRSRRRGAQAAHRHSPRQRPRDGVLPRRARLARLCQTPHLCLDLVRRAPRGARRKAQRLGLVQARARVPGRSQQRTARRARSGQRRGRRRRARIHGCVRACVRVARAVLISSLCLSAHPHPTHPPPHPAR